jgi:integrase
MYAFQIFGDLPVSAIDTGLVLAVLQQKTENKSEKGEFWRLKTETASRLRGRIEAVLDWARVRGLRDGENPARWVGHLEHQLPAPDKIKTTKHHPALPYSEIGKFMAALRAMGAPSARALEFLILTAARSNEVRGATWDEIDFAKKMWLVPADRMKLPRPHRVPLPPPALRLLESLPRMAGTNLIFPSPQNKKSSDMVFNALLGRMGYGERITAHGFRSTFRTWAAEMTACPVEVMERALAHKEQDAVVEAYARSDLYDKRIRLMVDWAEFCGKIQEKAADVIPIRAEKR